MSIDLSIISQVSTVVIAICSVVGLVVGIHHCRLNKNIKQMNLCGHCFAVTQFSRDGLTDHEAHTIPPESPVVSSSRSIQEMHCPQPPRFSRESQNTIRFSRDN